MTTCNDCHRPLFDTPQGACFYCLTPEKAKEYARRLRLSWIGAHRQVPGRTR